MATQTTPGDVGGVGPAAAGGASAGTGTGTATAGGGQRHFQIPPYYRTQGLLTQEQASEKLRVLEDAFRLIFSERGRLSYQMMYTEVYQLMMHKYEAMLYKCIENSLMEHAAIMWERVLAVDDLTFLETLVETSGKYMKGAKMVSDISLYMENNCVERRPKVHELGAEIFGKHVLQEPSVADRVRRLTTEIVQRERSGEKPPSRQLLKELTTMMLSLKGDVYQPSLERPFIEASRVYYSAEAQRLFESSSAPVYISHVFRRLAQEMERVERCLAESTLQEISNVIKETMLVPYSAQLLEKEHSGVVALMREWRLKDLEQMYLAYLVIDDRGPMLERVKSFLLEEVSGLIQEPDMNKTPIALVDEMLRYRDRYDDLLDESCSSVFKGSSAKRRDPQFEREIQSAFVTLVNKNERFAEYLSLAVDAIIRKKGVTESECDNYFNKILVLFQYLRDKDVFEEYHKRHLAKRLLTKTNKELELSFVAKLKAESGHQFTAKIEGMFNDMIVSQETTDTFKSHAASGGAAGHGELSVHVLTTGFWPFSNPSTDITLPPRVDGLLQRFHQYYLSKHTGRRLTWMKSMGSADVRYVTKGKKYELNVSTLQMAVLMLYNNRDSWTMGELEEATQIPPAELKKQVMSLSMRTKTYEKILDRDSEQSKDISAATVVTVNPDFSSKHVKFKVASVVLKDTDERAKETRTKVDESRRWQLDAMIVRIMKARREIEHRQLVTDVLNLSASFHPSPDDIKKRIEDLIGRDYMERTPESRSRYVYLA